LHDYSAHQQIILVCVLCCLQTFEEFCRDALDRFEELSPDHEVSKMTTTQQSLILGNSLTGRTLVAALSPSGTVAKNRREAYAAASGAMQQLSLEAQVTPI